MEIVLIGWSPLGDGVMKAAEELRKILPTSAKHRVYTMALDHEVYEPDTLDKPEQIAEILKCGDTVCTKDFVIVCQQNPLQMKDAVRVGAVLKDASYTLMSLRLNQWIEATNKRGQAVAPKAQINLRSRLLDE